MPPPRRCGRAATWCGDSSRLPERDLGVLGDVERLDVVELACGTAYFSAWLARAGATAVALDLSGEQLATARRLQREHGPHFPLVQADARAGPPGERLCRSGGERARSCRLVRSRALAAGGGPAPAAGRAPRVPDQQPPVGAVRPGRRRGSRGERLLRGHREAYRVRWSGGGVEFHPSHGDWVRLLRASGFVVEAMHELFAPSDAGDQSLLRDRDARVGDQLARRGAVGGGASVTTAPGEGSATTPDS